MTTKKTTQPTAWHEVLLWFLGAIALIALASPAPQIATWVCVLIIAYLLLSDWPVYKAYLGM